MRDLLPRDMARFRVIEDVFRKCCSRYGYEEVRTPLLEHLHLFTATGTLTPSMLGKVYSFLDWDGWSGERVVLRPDGTIPVARLYVDRMAEQEVAKLCYVADIFAFEESGTRNRERWQCGAEFLGGSRLVADGETISMAMDVVQRLGVEPRIQISHAGLVKALISELKLEPEQQAGLVDRVLDGDWSGLRNAAAGFGDLNKLLQHLLTLKGRSCAFLENAKALYRGGSERVRENLDSFIEVAALLDGLDYQYEIDVTAMQGFEYYTGIFFQLMAGEERIGGGGRYDDLIPMMSDKHEPACGFALYMDPLIELLPADVGKEAARTVLVQGNNGESTSLRRCCVLANALRRADYTTELDLPGHRKASHEWIVSVSTGEPAAFTVVNCAGGEEKTAASVEQVLQILGG
ncbi:MAG: ATP phosphoribosyltransferase regulatory subunit [Chloroflexota bacterium]